MGILFSFCTTELVQIQAADVFTENVGHFVWFFKDHVDREAGFVARHRGKVQILDLFTSFESSTFDALPLIIRQDECFRNFACSVSSIIQEDDGITILDECWAIFPGDRSSRDEFVSLAVCIGWIVVIRLNRCLCCLCGPVGSPSHHVVGSFHSLPTQVSVHGVETSHDTGDTPDTRILHFFLQLADKTQASCWRGIATIRDGVNGKLFTRKS